jgi:hypothetical protein
MRQSPLKKLHQQRSRELLDLNAKFLALGFILFERLEPQDIVGTIERSFPLLDILFRQLTHGRVPGTELWVITLFDAVRQRDHESEHRRPFEKRQTTNTGIITFKIKKARGERKKRKKYSKEA